MEYPSIAIPGQPLGPASQYVSGPGTHIQNSQLCASILGPVVERVQHAASGKSKVSSGKARETPLPVLSIQRSTQPASNDAALTNILPEVDAVVLARVTRINPRQATVAILVVGETVCSDEFPGLIR
jgi:exosome complex component CSL4